MEYEIMWKLKEVNRPIGFSEMNETSWDYIEDFDEDDEDDEGLS